MKHNILKRTLAAGLAVLCAAAYAPTFGNTGLFDISVTVSAEGEEKTWTNTITEGGVYTCPATLSSNVVISGGTEDNPVVIKIDGDVTSTAINGAFVIKEGYVRIIGTNNATISCTSFIYYSSAIDNEPTGDANITVNDIVVDMQSTTGNMVQLSPDYNCTTNFEKVTFKNFNNTSNSSSGAIVIINNNSTHIFKNCTFEDNTGCYSGAIRLTRVNATMENCTFKNCKASNSSSGLPGGGAIFVDSDTDLTLDNCTIENCTGKFGAVSVRDSSATLNLKGNTTITDNSTGNIYLPIGATFKVDEDFTGKAGVTTRAVPSASRSVTLSTGLGETQAALANKNIISDKAAYTVKYDNGKLLLVKPVPVTGITLDETLALNVGETGTLAAAITPDNATDQTLTWTSSDTTVATVDENGTITAVGAGTATITATATNGTEDTSDDVSATCTVTVNALSWISNDCTVTLDNGTLTVSKTEGAATGDMADYMEYDAPWKDYLYYIKSVIVEDGVTHIGDQSFYECENLETITVNSNLTSTGYQFAYSCNKLKTVTFNGNVEVFDDIYSCEKLESVTFNGNVGTIKPCGFDSNSSLKNVTFNGSVKHFDYYAFVDCPSLETVTLTPQENGTLEIGEPITDNTTAKIKYANTSGYLYDGETRIEDGALISDLQGKTLTWGPVYADGIGERLAGYTLSLDGDIGVNFYVELSSEVVADGGAHMHFTLPNGTTKDVYLGDSDHWVDDTTVPGKTYHVFKCNVAAKEMTSNITAQMVTSNGTGTEYPYTVRQYADAIIASPETYNSSKPAELSALVKAMLTYGGRAQSYFEYNDTDLANDGIEYTGDDFSYNSRFTKPEKNASEHVSYYGTSILLRDKTVQRHYFKLADPENIDMYSFTIGGTSVTPVRYEDGSSYYYIDSAPIKATDLGTPLTVVVSYEGNEAISFSYCPMDYAVYDIENSTAAKDVMQALYWYWQAAQAYADRLEVS